MEVFKQGQIIFKQGDQADAVYMIERGTVTIMVDNKEHTKKSPVNLLKKGDILGEISFIMQKPRNATALAQTEVVLKRLDNLKCKELLIHLAKKMEKMNEFIMTMD